MASHTRLFQAQALSSGTGTATNSLFTTSQYMAVKGASGTQRIDWNEVLISGFATSSAPALFQVTHVSVLETTPTALAVATASDGPMDSSAGAMASAPVTFIAAATQPTSTNNTTDPRLNVGLNTNGGILRWVAAPNMNSCPSGWVDSYPSASGSMGLAESATKASKPGAKELDSGSDSVSEPDP